MNLVITGRGDENYQLEEFQYEMLMRDIVHIVEDLSELSTGEKQATLFGCICRQATVTFENGRSASEIKSHGVFSAESAEGTRRMDQLT